jgi:aldehyde:ferredoxin oxidoreductase
MGSKGLKAIAVRGSGGVQVADPGKLIEFCREYFLRAKGTSATKHYAPRGTKEEVYVKDRVWLVTHEFTSKFRDLGTAEDVLVHNSLGCLPTRNFNSGTFEGAVRISGEQLKLQHTEKINACSPCPISCEHIAVVKEGLYENVAARIEYSSIWAFGAQCGIDRLDAIIKAVELCNFYGLDETSTGNIVGFAMDCYEKGILTYEDIDLDLRFGNHQAMLELIRRIGSRDGLGDILAEGVKRAAERIDKGAENLANHIKGLEMNGYDPRCLKITALGYAVSFIGADNTRHESQLLDIKGKTNKTIAEKGRGKLVKDLEDYYAVVDSLLVCRHLIGIYEGFEGLANLYTTATGISITTEEMRLAGERINNLARVFNIQQGLTREDDHLPQKIMSTPLPDGVHKGSIITKQELDLLLDDYYEARGWNKKGVPTQDKLKELDIEMR